MTGEATDNGIVSLRQQVDQVEESRKCSICGGPDHHGCGCEAKAAAAKIEQPALKIEPSVANIADELKQITEAVLKAGIDDVDEALSQLIDSREAQLAAFRDSIEQLKIIGEQLKIIAGSFKVLVVQKEIYGSLRNGGRNGN